WFHHDFNRRLPALPLFLLVRSRFRHFRAHEMRHVLERIAGCVFASARFRSSGQPLTCQVSNMNSLLQWLATLGVTAGFFASLIVSLGCRKTETPSVGGPSPASANEVQTEPSRAKTSGAAPTKVDPFAPLVEVADEDYAQARNRFRTRLK